MRFEICNDCGWGFVGCSSNVQEMLDAHECTPCECAIELEPVLVAV